MKNLFFLVFVALLMGACQTSSDQDAEAAQQKADSLASVGPLKANLGLETNTWKLISYGTAENPTQVPGGVTATLSFQGENQLGGTAGCNSYFGPYMLTDDSLKITGPIGLSRKMCDSKVMEVEQAYMKALETAATYAFEGDVFRINCAEGQVLTYKLKM